MQLLNIRQKSAVNLAAVIRLLQSKSEKGDYLLRNYFFCTHLSSADSCPDMRLANHNQLSNVTGSIRWLTERQTWHFKWLVVGLANCIQSVQNSDPELPVSCLKCLHKHILVLSLAVMWKRFFCLKKHQTSPQLVSVTGATSCFISPIGWGSIHLYL